jgi:deoxyribodipyrimidine photo-lyase
VKTVIHWFRRDLRVSDNTALAEASRRSEVVRPVFILDDDILGAPDMGAARVSFLLGTLRSLQNNLAALGYDLIIRRGKPEEELLRVCRETHAEAVFCNRDYEPWCQSRDSRIFNLLNAGGIGFEIFKDAVIWEESEILTKSGTPYTVFTPYSKAWKARAVPPPRPALKPASTRPKRIASLELPATSDALGFPLNQSIPEAGEQAAREALRKFMSKSVLSYGKLRDFPAVDATSHLSAHLHFGAMNIRTILSSLAGAMNGVDPQAKAQADVFLNELIWREFYIQIMTNFPYVMKGSFRRQCDALVWSENKEHFQKWCEGQTGYPIIDAAMRCLNATGWMHNRLRMIVAMFLTKDLLISWQWGERYFMRKLMDGDAAANNGGWQWSAGTGTDAAPYFRIFNPTAQAMKFDPDGAFVRKWVPELSHLERARIHEPWEESVPVNYPGRIVMHEDQRSRWLEMFQKVKGVKITD